MKTSIEFLDAVKAKTGAVSDYQLAKILNVTRAGISSYRMKRSYFDDEMCLKVASILEIEPFLVLASIHAERAKTAPEKAAWLSAFEKFGGMAASFVFASALLAQPAPAEAAQVVGVNSVYYVK